jgi:hypothetical protein
VKIAIYKLFSSERIAEVTDWREADRDYIRLSEPFEVEFVRLPPEVTVPREVAALDAAEQELRLKFAEKLAELSEKRANLLALTHQPSEVA